MIALWTLVGIIWGACLLALILYVVNAPKLPWHD